MKLSLLRRNYCTHEINCNLLLFSQLLYSN